MIKNDIKVGTRIELYGHTLEVTHRLGNEVNVMDITTGLPRKFTLEELQEYEAQGILQVEVFSLSPDSPSQLSRKEKLKLQAKRRYIFAALSTDSPCSQAVLATVIDSIHNKNPEFFKPSPSTLARWVRECTRSQEQTIKPTQHHKKGNRTHRFDFKTRKLMKEVVDKFYLSDQRRSVSTCYKLFFHEMDLAGYPPKSVPSLRTFSRFIEGLNLYEKKSKRHGKYHARKVLKNAGENLETDYPLEWAQADGHILDVLIVDDRGDLIGRAYATVILDLHTRCVLAFTVTLMPFSTATLLLALKDAYSATYSGMGGGIQNLIIDNGADYISNSNKAFCDQVGTTLHFSQPYQPQRKAEIERFFRTLNAQLIHDLPGTTFSNPDDKGDYGSEQMAVTRMDKLCELIKKWVTEDYHRNTHSTTGRMPELLWKDAVIKEPPFVYDRKVIDMLARIRVSRVINKGRVKFQNLRWHSPSLANLEQVFRQKHAKAKVTVLIDPSNLSSVLVEHPDDKNAFIQGESTQPRYTKELSLYEHTQVELMRKKQAQKDSKIYSETYRCKVRYELHMDMIKMKNSKAAKKQARRAMEEYRLQEEGNSYQPHKGLREHLEKQENRSKKEQHQDFKISKNTINIEKF